MFEDLSGLIRGNKPRLSYGVAVTDVDGDGRFEFVVTGFGCENLALAWRDGGLVDIADATFGDATRQAIGVAAGDIDGDGREEIYVLNTDTFAGAKQFGDRLFARTADGFVDLFSLPQNAEWLNLTAGRSVAVLDRRGDGAYSFAVANYGGPLVLYEIDDRGRVRDAAADAGLVKYVGDRIRPYGGRALLPAPLVADSFAHGRVDLFAGNENSPNTLFIADGRGGFREAAGEFGVADPEHHVRGVAVLDVNEDGLFDLVYGNWEGPHRCFVQSSLGFFGDVGAGAFAQPSRVRTVIAADFDNDGYEELFFNNIGEPNRLFRRSGPTQWLAADPGALVEPGGLGTGAAVADIDGDGWLEVLVAHGEQALQPLTLYRARRDDRRHWLRVAPLTATGAPARGATVEIDAGGRTQRRVIDGGSGYLCQMEPVAHFGLGEVDRVERIMVRWPGGRQWTLGSAAADQTLVVDQRP